MDSTSFSWTITIKNFILINHKYQKLISNYLRTILKQRFASLKFDRSLSKIVLRLHPDRKNLRESSTSAGNRLVRVASARCAMHYRCNAGPHTHTWRENGGRGGVDSIFPSLSLPLSRLLLSLLLSNVNPSCHPWVQPLSSLKRATSIPR